MRSRLLLLCAAVGTSGCFAASTEPQSIDYHNPLDVLDAGNTGPGGQGRLQPPDSGATTPPPAAGTVDGRTPSFQSATYFVQVWDAGPDSVSLFISDVADLCQAADAGMGSNWDVLRLRLSGAHPGTFPVSTLLAPSGAIGELDYQDDAGGFGVAVASGGSIEIDAIDPGNEQSSSGSYTLTFEGIDGGTASFSGEFIASPCPTFPPTPD